ncbi:MAG: sensor histidine kinase, partial [Bacteroidetes bacterium]
TGVVKIQFRQEGTEVEFNEQNSIFLFRIFQEALNNTLKHAKATEIIINLDYSEGAFILEMRDNGIGFDLAKKQQSATSYSGVGLKSMFNRAKLIGAHISINSEYGKGTIILIKLPLQNE